LLRRLWEKLKLLWTLAKSERATPREIGWAVGIGAFVGCSPAFGLRPWLAIGIATLLKKNRLFCWLGSHTSFWLWAPFIVLAEVQLAHRIRTGSFVALDRDNVVDQAPHLLLDWCIGWLPVGGLIAIALGFSAYGFARRRDTRRRIALEKAGATPDEASETNEAPAATPLKPTEAQPPSSGSPA
jgi:uncharacterized protein (DUF2062 family)